MAALRLQFLDEGVHVPELGLWLDSRQPQTGLERVFISHAHADHVGAHREVILSKPTAEFLRARLGGERVEHVLPFAEPRRLEWAAVEGDAAKVGFQITLLPAGHILGSAMALIRSEKGSLLYTGDFKLRPGLSAEACDPSPARGVDTLIMETTYGRPEYRFPATEAVLRGIVRFCQEALHNEATAVLLGYSLGKSQELLHGLAEADLPIVLHGAVFKLTQIYERLGQTFPKYERYQAGATRGKVLIGPPSIANSTLLRNLGQIRVAVLTGWAVDPNCRFRYGADAAFPLSDHADFPELLELVERVAPREVYTLHGFAADFAQTLRERGYEARALSEDDQLSLALDIHAGSPAQVALSTAPRLPSGRSWSMTASAHEPPGAPSRRSPSDGSAVSLSVAAPTDLAGNDTFLRFAVTCAVIAAAASKLEKVRLLAEYLQRLPSTEVRHVVTWFTGVPFASSENKVLQLGWALLRDALCAVAKVGEAELRQVYLKHSDLGETASEVLQTRAADSAPSDEGSLQRAEQPARRSLTISFVQAIFQHLHAARGPSGKLPLLIETLSQCTALEAKFFVKIITSDLRIGLKEGLVEEAVAQAFHAPLPEVRRANLLLGHIGEAAELARRSQLSHASLVPFRPVKFMLASPEPTAAAIWERVQRRTGILPVPGSAEELRDRQDACPTLWIEDKYDGIRCQLHKAGQRVALYSRDLKDITATFFDLADAARGLSADVVLDGEIVGMRGDSVLAFAELQKRLGRKEGDLFLGGEIPIKLIAFDLLWCNGEPLLDRPLRERRADLEGLAPVPDLIRLARVTPAGSEQEIEAAFAAARERENEGLIIKDPASVYAPGRRGLAWLKLKKPLATLDCVVVGAEYGHGKRKGVLSDYTFAVRDERSGELKIIGKAYTGLTDEEIARLTEHFLGKAIRQQGRYYEVEPDVVLEIAFDKLQASQRHSSGLAMRFPRIVRIRTDKTAADIDTLASARRLAT